MKKLIMLAVGLYTAQLVNAQNTHGDGYINSETPQCTVTCPNASNVAASNFFFSPITTNAPANQMYGYLGTATHNPVTKVEFTYSRATKTTKCGNTSTDATVMLQQQSGKFEIKPNATSNPTTSVNASINNSTVTGTINFPSPGKDLWTTNSNLTILSMKPNFSVLPAIPAGCTETYTITVAFTVTFANGCKSKAVYPNVKIVRQ